MATSSSTRPGPMLVGRRTPGAGVRKPPREETAGGVERSRVRRYGDFVAGGLLPTCVERWFGKYRVVHEPGRAIAIGKPGITQWGS
jgi:hypothetical protein